MSLPPIYDPHHYPLSDPMHHLVRTLHRMQKELEQYSHSFHTTNSRINLAWYTSKRIQSNAFLSHKASWLEIKSPEFEELISSTLEAITVALKEREKLTSPLEFYTVSTLCDTVKSAINNYMLLNHTMSKYTDFEKVCPVQNNLSERFNKLLAAILRLEEIIAQMRQF